MVKEGATGSDKLKDSEKKRMDLIQENKNLQKILKACREQEDHTRQEMASLEELLSRLYSEVRRVEKLRHETSYSHLRSVLSGQLRSMCTNLESEMDGGNSYLSLRCQ